MNPGDLVKHKSIESLGIGLVAKGLGMHCMVLWTGWDHSGVDLSSAILEVNLMLEVINASG